MIKIKTEVAVFKGRASRFIPQ